jgi:hypothetical protein
MKKIFILSLVFLCGCAATKNVIYTKNPNCTNIKGVKVFQVFEGGALATTSSLDSIVVFLPESDKYKLYDGAKIQRQDNECIVYDGVYKYVTAGDDKGIIKYLVSGKEKSKIEYTANQREKTVPVAKFEKRWLDMD